MDGCCACLCQMSEFVEYICPQRGVDVRKMDILSSSFREFLLWMYQQHDAFIQYCARETIAEDFNLIFITCTIFFAIIPLLHWFYMGFGCGMVG
mmetsp:Transcript_27584/g.36631  ORF Transcript_27584/g.36631 Transcript_27584/m.36631 type:complete len:94 (+) Transcript_27584:726-1007(+)